MLFLKRLWRSLTGFGFFSRWYVLSPESILECLSKTKIWQGIWTFLAISYKPAAVRWFPLRSGRVYIVPLETLTLLLWLLGFVAAASLAIELEPLCLALSSVSFFSKYLKVCLYVKIAAAITAVGW